MGIRQLLLRNKSRQVVVLIQPLGAFQYISIEGDLPPFINAEALLHYDRVLSEDAGMPYVYYKYNRHLSRYELQAPVYP